MVITPSPDLIGPHYNPIFEQQTKLLLANNVHCAVFSKEIQRSSAITKIYRELSIEELPSDEFTCGFENT